MTDDDAERERRFRSLSERDREVLKKRFGIDLTNLGALDKAALDALERQLNVTRQLIREIEERAKKKLKGNGPDED
jgi:DNA-directed RNA polymerase sigma subunit (sigma70/sigma32)